MRSIKLRATVDYTHGLSLDFDPPFVMVGWYLSSEVGSQLCDFEINLVQQVMSKTIPPGYIGGNEHTLTIMPDLVRIDNFLVTDTVSVMISIEVFLKILECWRGLQLQKLSGTPGQPGEVFEFEDDRRRLPQTMEDGLTLFKQTGVLNLLDLDAVVDLCGGT